MAFVADFMIIQVGQVHIFDSQHSFEFFSDIGNSGFAIFQMMYRGLNRSQVSVEVNGRKATDLNPYVFADENAWFQTTFITPPGVVVYSSPDDGAPKNRITFSGVSALAEPTGYFVSNLFMLTQQEA